HIYGVSLKQALFPGTVKPKHDAEKEGASVMGKRQNAGQLGAAKEADRNSPDEKNRVRGSGKGDEPLPLHAANEALFTKLGRQLGADRIAGGKAHGCHETAAAGNSKQWLHK